MSTYGFRFEVIENITKASARIDRAFGGMARMAQAFTNRVNVLPASITQLNSRIDQLTRAQAESFSIREIRRYGQEIDTVRHQVARLRGDTERATKTTGGMPPMLRQIGALAAGAFAVSQVVDFGRAVVTTLADFEKYEAVLTNTFGDNAKAKSVMQDITQLAATTPYSVSDLTEGFVKLQNRGMKPTMDMLTQIGDLAASQGKDFMQVTEAVMDAPVKQFIRLQESLGIDVQTLKGGLLQLKGLGITKIIKDDPETIKNTVLELSKLPQVAGAMAAISKTTGGMLSNMEDQMQSVRLSIGRIFQPFLAVAIPQLTNGLGYISNLVTVNQAAVSAGVDKAMATIQPILNVVKQYFVEVFDFFKGLLPVLQPFAQSVFDVFKSIGQAIVTVAPFVLKVISVVRDVLRPVIVFVGQLLTVTFQKLGGFFNAIADWMNRNQVAINAVIDGVGQAIKVILGVVVIVAQVAFAVGKAIYGIVAWVVQLEIGIGQAIYRVVTYIGELAARAWKNNPFTWMVDLIDRVFPGFKSALNGLWDWAKNMFSSLWDYIWNSLIKPLTGWLSSVWENLGLGTFGVSVTGPETQTADVKAANAIAAQTTVFDQATGNKDKTKAPPDAAGVGVNDRLQGAVSGGREGVKNITIQIGKQIESLVFQTTNLSESKDVIRRELERLMLDVANDANYAI